MKRSFYIIISTIFIFFSITQNALSKENEKLKLMINRSFNNFENLFVIDENTIASLEKYKEIWDIKNKRLIESTSYKDKFIDSYGLPGVASNISNDKTIYNDELDSFSEDCPSTFDLKNGGKIKCDRDYTDVSPYPIPILSEDEYKKIKRLPRNVNNLNITNNVLNDYGLNIKLEEKKVEIKRNYLNVLKIFDKLSNKHKRIWGDNIYWTDNKYFILEKNILKAYSLNSLSLEKEFKVLNNLENVYEYENKLIIQYKNKVDVLDFKSGKVLYSINDDTKNTYSKNINIGDNKIIITYAGDSFFTDFYYDSNKKIYTKIFNINSGKFISKIEVKSDGRYYGIRDCKVDNKSLVGRMGPTSNWIDIWNLNTGKLKHIIVPIGSMKTFNVYERKVILGNYNSYFEIYDIKTGKLIKSIEKDPSSNKEDLRFSSDIIKTIIYKNKIISSYFDNTIKILDLNTGKLLKVLSGHKKEINDIYIEKDLLVSIDKYGLINTWDLKSGKLINTKQSQIKGELKVHNSRIFIKGQEEVIDIIDTKNQKLIKTIKNYDSPITSIVKDNNTIYAGTMSGDIYVIDYIKGELIQTIKSLDNIKISFILLDNKNNLIYGNYKGKISIYNLSTFKKNELDLKNYIENTYIHEDKLFFELLNKYSFEDKKLFIIDYLSGKINIQEILDYYRSITFFKNKIYYVSEKNSLKELDINTNQSKDIISNDITIKPNIKNIIDQNIKYISNDNYLISIFKYREDSDKLILEILDFKNNKIKKVFDTEKSDLTLINNNIYNNKLYLLKNNSKEEYFIEVIDLEQGTLISRDKLNNLKNLRKDIYQRLEYIFIKNKLISIAVNKNSQLDIFNLDTFSNLKIIKEYLIAYTDKIIVTQNNTSINIWDIDTLNKIDSIRIGANEKALFFKENRLVTQKDNQIYIYDMRTYNKIFSFLDKELSGYLEVNYLDNENFIYNINLSNFKNIDFKTKKITKLIDINIIEKTDNNYISFKKNIDNSNNYNYNIYDLKNKKILYQTKDNYYNEYYFYPDKNKILLVNGRDIIVKNLKNNITEKEFKNYDFILNSNIFYNTEKLILKNEEGDIEIFDISTLKLLAKYYIFKSVTFIITPEGYFYGEGDYKNYFHFISQNGEYISLDKLNEFNRPDVVQKAINGEDISSYKTLEYSM